jgi:hypothetical protein
MVLDSKYITFVLKVYLKETGSSWTERNREPAFLNETEADLNLSTWSASAGSSQKGSVVELSSVLNKIQSKTFLTELYVTSSWTNKLKSYWIEWTEVRSV